MSISFANAKAIGPSVDNWPENYDSPIYWLARKTFSLSEVPDRAEILIAADRHYEIFINGHRIARHRGFFNGDEYIFAQQWQDEICEALCQGNNIIEIVVRSDPWRNKNYRCFRPMLILEAKFSSADNEYKITSDTDWKLAIISNWREEIHRGAIGTIHFEKIELPSAKRTILSGFSQDNLSPVPTVQINNLPVIYLWTSPPVRIDIHSPQQLIKSGNCFFLTVLLSSTFQNIHMINQS